jgi:hypothetical protein
MRLKKIEKELGNRAGHWKQIYAIEIKLK